jgi:polyisoprenoid-binding protein YceI
MRLLLLAALLALALPADAQGARKIDRAGSSIRFVVRQMNVPVEGQFKRFDGSVAFDPAKPEATRAEFEVELGSIDLGSEEGEVEARGKSWLNAGAFPKARFVADSVKATGPNQFVAAGALTIKGVAQPVSAPFTLTDAGATRTVAGQFTLKRLAFKIGEGVWADTDTVADEIVVRFRFSLPKT